jgi:hypothetical protein
MSAARDVRLGRIRALQQAYSGLQQELPLLQERIDLLRTIITDKTHPNLDDSHLAQHRYELGAALYDHFTQVYEVGDLIEAEANLRLAISGTDHEALATETSSLELRFVLGSVLRERAYEMDSHSLAEEALSLHRQPFQVDTNLTKLERAHHCRELGLTLRIHYYTNTVEELSLVESVQQLRAAQTQFAELGVVDHICSAGLIHSLVSLYIKQRNKDLLNEAMSMSELALMKCPHDHRDFYRVLLSALSAHRCLAWFCDDMVPVIGTLDVLRSALPKAPAGWAILLTVGLIEVLQFQFMKQGDEESLSEAITRVTTLLDGSSSDALRWDTLQFSLSRVLVLRFRLTGAAEDIENAARAAKLAVSKTEVGASNVYLIRLSQLASRRDVQYQAFGDMAHLDDCIALHEQIVQMTPPGNQHRILAEMNLVGALRLRAESTRSMADLNRAIELAPDSTTSKTFDHPNGSTMLHKVGHAFLLRFEMTGSLEDLERATTYYHEGVQRATAQTGSSQGFEFHRVVNAYSKVLRIRYEVLQEAESISVALAQQRRLVHALPIAHRDRTSILCGLAQILICADPGSREVKEALSYLMEGLSNSYCPAYSRLKDVTDVLTYLTHRIPNVDQENAVELAMVYSTAISLLPQVASFGLEPRVQLSVISGSGRLIAEGASHAASIGQHELALEMLEAGRSVFWTQGLHLRTPFTNLPSEIGDRLNKITFALGQPMPDSYAEESAKERELARRRRLGDDFASVLAEARLLPGFEDLLQNASFASLARAAHSHPIVVLVAGDSIGHGIIILDNARCVLVTLEKVTNATLQGLSHRIGTHSEHVRSRGIRKVRATEVHPTDVYREIWTLVMAPIINALGWPVSRVSYHLFIPPYSLLYREHKGDIDPG